jgi:hypothetical protein
MGAVYKARQASMDRPVAIKVLLPKLADDADGRERFIREAKAAAKLSHPNVVAGIDAGETDGLYYFVMEFLDGEPLDAILKKRTRLPWREAVSVIRHVALGLGHAHDHGMVHRDVKPGNIMLLHDGTAKLADLGLVRVSSSDVTLTQSGMILGSPAYVSPEQATGERDIDIRSDLYSLGLTLFELIAGERAYGGDTPMAAVSVRLTKDIPIEKLAGVPADVVAVITRLCRRARAERYTTPRELIDDLDALLAGKTPGHAHGIAPRGSWIKPFAAIGAAVAVAAVACAAALLPRPPLGLLDAVERAAPRVPDGRIYKVELEGGGYSIDFARGARTVNINVNADNGRIVATHDEPDDYADEVAACRIAIPDAVAAAVALLPGRPVELELMLWRGRSVIQVLILGENGLAPVQLDGVTGTTLSLTRDEVAEARHLRGRR